MVAIEDSIHIQGEIMKNSNITKILALLTFMWLYSANVMSLEVEVYKSPTCGCCSAWVDHLKDNGIMVKTYDVKEMDNIKKMAGIPVNMQSCHTALVNDYLIEGHVPADLIKKMVKEKPDIRGLAVPGMVMGSPGMEGDRKDPYEVLTMEKDGNHKVYAKR
jgi:hypothetical protein